MTEPLLKTAAPDFQETEVNRIPALVRAQRTFFALGRTRELDFRLEQLKKFRQMLLDFEPEIYQALHQDLRKPAFEAYVGELGMVLHECRHTLKNLKKWMKPVKAAVPLAIWPASAKVYSEPYGVVLNLSPWNYPIQLALTPVLGAMAAGNCVILKPSELAPRTSELLHRLISESFPPEYFNVIQGGVEVTTALLAERFDYLFFTGSPRVGKVIMEAAAKHLTPMTLELGGKSPCLVDETARLDVTARRVVWGKFFNAGQTCVAPDYLLVHRSVRSELLARMRDAIETFYSQDPQKSPDYARIINAQHFQRLASYLAEGEIIVGGQTDPAERYIAPTLIQNPRPGARLMQEEIFGPILPVVEYQELSEALRFIEQQPKPLSFYYFTSDPAREREVIAKLQFGGGCINDTMDHLAVPDLSFGGVGDSGFGGYHGKRSFDTFSHKKSLLKKPYFMDLKIKYPPYKDRLSLAKKLLK